MLIQFMLESSSIGVLWLILEEINLCYLEVVSDVLLLHNRVLLLRMHLFQLLLVVLDFVAYVVPGVASEELTMLKPAVNRHE